MLLLTVNVGVLQFKLKCTVLQCLMSKNCIHLLINFYHLNNAFLFAVTFYKQMSQLLLVFLSCKVRYLTR